MLHWGAERCAPQDEPRQKGLCVRTRECVHAGGVWLSEAVGRKWRSGAAVEPGESSQGVAVEMACGAQLGARCGALFLGAENRGRLRRGRTGLYVFTRRRGANTAHIQMGRPTHEAPTREYTHKHKHSPRYIYIRWEGEYINTPEGCQRCANAAHTLKCTTG